MSNEDGSSTYAFFNEAGSSDIYYANSKKFETTNDGTVTTGICTATDFSGASGGAADFPNGLTGTTGSFSSNLTVGSGITFGSAGVATFTKNVTIDGDVAIGLEGATASGLSPVLQLHQKASSATSYLHITNTDSGVANSDGFVIGFNGSNDALIFNKESTPLRLATAGTERIRVTAGGQVGINSSDPDVDLVVSHAGQNTGMGVTVYINSQKNNASAIGSAELRLGFKHSGNNNGKGDAYIKLEEDGTNSFDGNLTIGVPVNNGGGGSTTWDSVKFEGGQTGVDVSLSGTASGIASVFWDASANTLFFNDDSETRFGTSGDLRIYHDSANSHINNSTGTLRIRGDSIKINNAAASKNAIVCESDVVTLYYDNSAKLATTNDGVVITGITTFTKGCNFKGILKERHKQTDAKLSADVNIDLELGNVHYYSVNETTTATPNIRYNSSYSLNSKMNIGETVSVTIIYKPNNAGYYASLNVDGSGVTEEWNGGSAPDSANSSGYDILTHTLLKVADASVTYASLMFKTTHNGLY